jgi:hypothetical protein
MAILTRVTTGDHQLRVGVTLKRSYIWKSSALLVSMVFVFISKKHRERRSERKKDSSSRRGKNKGLLIEELALMYIVMTIANERKGPRV